MAATTTTYPYLKYYPLYARIWPRVSGTLSILGSSYIAYDVVRRKKLAKINHRILLGMSITDAVSSFCTVLGRLPAPKTAKYYTGLGTTATCTAQGFFYQSILSTVAYNAALSVYFLLVVKFKWKECDPNMKRLEWALHIFSMLLFLGSGFSLLALDFFNPGYFLCFIAEYPRGCYYKPDIPCTRAGNPDPYRWAFFYGPVWAMILTVTVIMGIVYWTVLQQERKMDRFQFHASSVRTTRDMIIRESTHSAHNRSNNTRTQNNGSSVGKRFLKQDRPRPSQQSRAVMTQRKHSKNVATQGMWYLVPFYLTWLFPMLVHALSSAEVDGVNYLVLLKLTSVFMPLQGFMNMCVYLRPTVMRWIREKRKNDSYFSSFGRKAGSSNPSSGTTPTTTNIQSSIQSNRSSMGAEVGGRGAVFMSSFMRSINTSSILKSFRDNNKNEIEEEEEHNNMHTELQVIVLSPSGDSTGNEHPPQMRVQEKPGKNNSGDGGSTVDMGLSFSDFDISFRGGCANGDDYHSHDNRVYKKCDILDSSEEIRQQQQALIESQRETCWLDNVMEESDSDDDSEFVVAVTSADVTLEMTDNTCSSGDHPKRASMSSMRQCQLDDKLRASNTMSKQHLSSPSLEILAFVEPRESADVQLELPPEIASSTTGAYPIIADEGNILSKTSLTETIPIDPSVLEMTDKPQRAASAPVPSSISANLPYQLNECEIRRPSQSSLLYSHSAVSPGSKSSDTLYQKEKRRSSSLVHYVMNSPTRSSKNDSNIRVTNNPCSTPSSVQSAPPAAKYGHDFLEPEDEALDQLKTNKGPSSSFEIV